MATASDSRDFERFIDAVHRRMVLLRALERVGLCVLGGCVVAAALAPILMARGEPTGNLILAALGAAVVAGVFWGTLSRPTRLAAATEADRQLRLADLLGTAVALRANRNDDAMTTAVLALADARCRTTTPATVVLHRFGARGWGGIGLALAFVAGLNLLGPEPTRSAHRESAQADSWEELEAAANKETKAARTPRAPDLRRAKAGNGADEPDARSSDVPDDRPPSVNSGSPGSTDKGTGGGDSDGTGAGTGQSSSGKPEANPIIPKAGSRTDQPNNGTTAAAGVGSASTGGDRPGDPAGTGSGQGGPGSRRPAPPWRSAGWAEDRGAAEAAVREGRVPDAYRDLVRGYFKAD